MKERILCLVPLAPPVTGAAVASEAVIDQLRARHEVVVLPFQRGNLLSGEFSVSQALRILLIGLCVLWYRLTRRFDHAYLVISPTSWGNIRDIFFLVLLGKRLRERTVVHNHSANFAPKGGNKWIRLVNRKLLGQVQNAIILGDSFVDMFEGFLPFSRVRIVKNFFEGDLLIPVPALSAKFGQTAKIKILFLSNIIKEKGYQLLLDGFLGLPDQVRGRAELHFVGEIKSSAEREALLSRMDNTPDITYHGPLTGAAKRDLLWDAHVFCLPTQYVYEGQPITILEAYAAGCIVITSPNGGIKDIFTDQVNGLYVAAELANCTVENLAAKLSLILSDISRYAPIGFHNRSVAAAEYAKQKYCDNVQEVITPSPSANPALNLSQRRQTPFSKETP